MSALGYVLLGIAAAMAALAWRLMGDRIDGLEQENRELRARIAGLEGRRR